MTKSGYRFFAACGRRGGRRRARKLAASRRSAIASHAAQVRWKRETPAARTATSVRLREPQFEEPTYLEEVLSVGSLEVWRELYQRIADQPFGPVANALENSLEHSASYGVTPLWKGILRTVRGDYETS